MKVLVWTLAVIGLALSTPALADDDWRAFGRTTNEQFYSPLDKINAANVKDLGLAWYQDLNTRRGIEATPLVIDGVMYNTLPWNITTAQDAKTGNVLWTYDPEVPHETGRLACCDVVTRGIAYWKGKIYIAALDGRLIAVDAKTGVPIWSAQTLEEQFPYTVTGAPRVFDGKVLIGNAGAELAARGYVSAYDAETGKQLWRFYTVPGDPAKGFENKAMEMAAKTWTGEWWKLGGGGTAWDAITYDPKLKLVYIGAGNGTPWVRLWRSPGGGDNLFLSSIIAVKADTGEYVWHYQQVPGEQFDYTATQPMILADLKIAGKTRQVLMQAPKNGYFYVLDRKTGELISAKPIATVTWSSGIDMKTGRPIFTPEADYGHDPVLISPAFIGAHNWHPMAFSPKTGLVYLPVADTTGIYSAAREFTPRRNVTNTGMGSAVTADARRRLQDEAASREKAWLAAWDPVNQREAWRVNYPKMGSGGVLATGGNLVFHGNVEKNFVAYRADTGEKLWETPVQNIAMAAPMTYAIDGEQFIAVNAGYGGGVAHGEAAAGRGPILASGRLLVFKLGGTAQLPPMEETVAYKPPPRVFMEQGEFEKARQLYETYCQQCHGTLVRGGLKDLRYMEDETRAQFAEIVLKGTRKAQGMDAFADVLSDDDVKLLKTYVALRAYEDYGPEPEPVAATEGN